MPNLAPVLSASFQGDSITLEDVFPQTPDPTLMPADGDGELEALLDASASTVLGWCRRLGGPKVDAEDAAQDVLLTAWKRFDSLREVEAFEAWLYGITRRVLAGHRRRAWVRRWSAAVLPEAVDPGRSPREEAELSEISAEVQRILEALPAAQREVLVLSDVEERTDAEVAAILGIPSGTVKSRLRLARGRFRRLASRNRELLLPGFTPAPSWGQG